MDKIPRVAELSVADFNAHFLSKGRPVVIENTVSDWPALKDWTIPKLAEKAAGMTGPIRFLSRQGWQTEDLPLSDFFNDVLAGRSGAPEPRYLTEYRIIENEQPIAPIGQVLLPDLGRIPYIPPNNYHITALFVGDDVETEAHYHHQSEAFLVMVKGHKTVIMIDPKDTRRLKKSTFNNAVNQFKYTDRADFELCDESWAQPVHLVPGDLLYIPLQWWHYVYAREPHISLTRWFRAQWRNWKWSPTFLPSLFEVAMSKRPLKFGMYSRLKRLATGR